MNHTWSDMSKLTKAGMLFAQQIQFINNLAAVSQIVSGLAKISHLKRVLINYKKVRNQNYIFEILNEKILTFGVGTIKGDMTGVEAAAAAAATNVLKSNGLTLLTVLDDEDDDDDDEEGGVQFWSIVNSFVWFGDKAGGVTVFGNIKLGDDCMGETCCCCCWSIGARLAACIADCMCAWTCTWGINRWNNVGVVL